MTPLSPLKPRNPRLNRQALGAKGIVGAWPFSEGAGSIVNDFSGLNRTGTLVGSPTWAAGSAGPAISLNGSSQYIKTNYTPSNKAITVAIGFNCTNGSVESRVFAGGFAGGAGNNASIQIDGVTASKLRGIIGGTVDGGTNLVVGTEISFIVGIWNRVVLVFDGANLIVYLNGVLGATNAASSTTLGTSNLEMLFGARRSSLLASFFPGLLDDPIISTRPWVPAEAQQDYRDWFRIYRQPTRRVGSSPAPATSSSTIFGWPGLIAAGWGLRSLGAMRENKPATRRRVLTGWW